MQRVERVLFSVLMLAACSSAVREDDTTQLNTQTNGSTGQNAPSTGTAGHAPDNARTTSTGNVAGASGARASTAAAAGGVAGSSASTGAVAGTGAAATSAAGGAAPTAGTAPAQAGASGSPGRMAADDPAKCPWRKTAPVTVMTPFAAPDNSLTFTPPTIACNIVDVTTVGVSTSGMAAANRAAINKAIADLSAAGGGVIDVPAGTYPMGAITLLSQIELHLQQGAVLSFSTDTSDYDPAVLTRWEGFDCMNWQPAIYALGATDVAITGQGKLHGPGSSWGGGTSKWKDGGESAASAVYKAWLSGKVADLKTSGPPTAANMAALQVPVAHTQNGLRPTFVECNGCTNFMVDGLVIEGGWYWNLHPVYSSNVILRNLTVDSSNGGSNGDGADPDSSTNVLIENVTFDTSDDMVSIKSGTNEVGFNIARPSHNIVAHNIQVHGGHGFSIGSELSGGVNNVYEFNDTQQTWSGPPQYLLRVKTPPGRGAVEIRDIWFQDVSGAASKNDVFVTNNYTSATVDGSSSLGTPTYKNINIKNVQGSSSKGSSCTVPLASKQGSTLAGNSGC